MKNGQDHLFNLALGDTCLVSINCIVLCKTYEIIMKNTSIAINGKGFLNSPLSWIMYEMN
jgi:hypothetical protein